jgi:hypothetical protein
VVRHRHRDRVERITVIDLAGSGIVHKHRQSRERQRKATDGPQEATRARGLQEKGPARADELTTTRRDLLGRRARLDLSEPCFR